jgi:hypothetical protein
MNHDVASICDSIAKVEGNYRWHLMPEGAHPERATIRGQYPGINAYCCPLLAYAYEQAYEDRSHLFNSKAGEMIMDAADDKPGHDPKVRQRLLEACGLAETESPVWTWLAVIGVIGLALAVLYRFQGS